MKSNRLSYQSHGGFYFYVFAPTESEKNPLPIKAAHVARRKGIFYSFIRASKCFWKTAPESEKSQDVPPAY